MTGRTNAVIQLGGSGIDTHIIVATYPYGATCALKQNDSVLAVSDTSGYYTFGVEDAGIYTVECEYEGITYQEQVTITAAKDVKYVKFNDVLLIYTNGYEPRQDITGGFSSVRGSMTFNEDYISTYWNSSATTHDIITNNRIDLTGYETLKVRTTFKSRSASPLGDANFGVSDSRTHASFIAQTQIPMEGTDVVSSLDISAISSGYIQLTSYRSVIWIHKIWLE